MRATGRLTSTRWTWVPAGILAFALVASACTSGSESAPTPSTTAEIRQLMDGAVLDAGRYALDLDVLRITLEVPAGWEAGPFFVVPTDGGADPPAGTAVGFWIVDDIFADPCEWDRGYLDRLGPSAEDLAAALKDQRGRYATTPIPGELNGRPTIEMELTVPPDLDLSGCSQERGTSYFVSWPQRDPPGGGRHHQGPGQHDRLWILEVDGVRLVVDASFFPETSASDLAELLQIVRSVHVD